jgi:hypothetical protein
MPLEIIEHHSTGKACVNSGQRCAGGPMMIEERIVEIEEHGSGDR